jgi:hypothetical protein
MVKKAASTEVANLQQASGTTEVTNLDAFNAFEAYGNSVSNRNIVGKLLKFSKGDYLAGEDAEEIDEGTQLVAMMHTLAIGWIKWVDNKPDQQIMGTLVEGFKPPRRSELGDADETEWEIDEQSGQPRDPWQYSNYVIFKEVGKTGEDENLYTFASSSKGGLGAIGDLCKVYGKSIRTKPDDLPIISLDVDAYEHSNKKFGRIKVPKFNVVGWEDKKVATGEAKKPAAARSRSKAA